MSDSLNEIKEALENLSTCKTHEIAIMKEHVCINAPTWLQWAVEELENKNTSIESLQQSSLSYQKVIDEQLIEFGLLEDEHRAMKEAMEFYGDASNWELPEFGRGHSQVTSDRGTHARSVLSTLSTKEESEDAR